MKPINSKERSKQVWQFIFIFFGLALVPVALIFFSYYHLPERISEADNRKLADYSNFNHAQKKILEKMAEIDSNIQRLATSKTENTVMLQTDVANGINELRKMDTSLLVQRISKSMEQDFTHVNSLIKAQNEANNNAVELQKAKDMLKAAPATPMGVSNGMPPMQGPPQN